MSKNKKKKRNRKPFIPDSVSGWDKLSDAEWRRARQYLDEQQQKLEDSKKKEPNIMSEKFIIISGNPVSGFSFKGPFDSEAQAELYADTSGEFDSEEWCIASLDDPGLLNSGVMVGQEGRCFGCNEMTSDIVYYCPQCQYEGPICSTCRENEQAGRDHKENSVNAKKEAASQEELFPLDAEGEPLTPEQSDYEDKLGPVP